ncbi:MAG: SH3 domain-containing protein [Candidatus Accumulibacter sp.]|jgi:SH3-like domain-containing protein|nr:SH3 domain-containing protein [Accumulibacter sp.]
MKRLLIPLLLSLALPTLPALAAEYRTTNAAAILYDAPSQKGNKLYVIRSGTPVDLVVTLEGWSKVRDADGSLTWIEKKYLSEKRTVIVVAPRAAIRKSADDAAPLVFEAEKNVSLDFLGTTGLWANVRHGDGQTGFVRLNQIWGI